jgi:hypothetical protein
MSDFFYNPQEKEIMLKKHHLASLVCGLSIAALSSTVNSASLSSLSNLTKGAWGFGGNLGYTNYSDQDAGSHTAVERFHIEKELKETNNHKFKIGLEGGVQNGNTMQIAVTDTQLTQIGGVIPWSTVKFMSDILVTFKYKPKEDSKTFLVVKGGAMWRQWVSNSVYINSLNQTAGELQAGIGTMVSDKVEFSVVYQGIYGASPNMTQNDSTLSTTDVQLVNVSNIPVQNGFLVGATVFF